MLMHNCISLEFWRLLKHRFILWYMKLKLNLLKLENTLNRQIVEFFQFVWCIIHEDKLK